MLASFGLVKTSPQKITDAIFIEIDNKLKIKKKNVSAMFNYLKKKKNNNNFSKNNFKSLIQNIGINNLNKINITTIYNYINKPLFSDIEELKNIIKNTITNSNKQLIYGINNTKNKSKMNIQQNLTIQNNSTIISPNNNRSKTPPPPSLQNRPPPPPPPPQNRTQNRLQPPPPPPRNRPPPPTTPKKNNNLNNNVSNHSHLNQKKLLDGLMKLKKVKNNTQKNNGNKSGKILNLNQLKPNQLMELRKGLKPTNKKNIAMSNNTKPQTELERKFEERRRRSEA
jgi:hypothetical protein